MDPIADLIYSEEFLKWKYQDHVYSVFTYIYSLLIKKDLHECRNISSECLFVALIQRSLHCFSKSFPFLFLFSCDRTLQGFLMLINDLTTHLLQTEQHSSNWGSKSYRNSSCSCCRQYLSFLCLVSTIFRK